MKKTVKLSKASQKHLAMLNSTIEQKPADNATADSIHGFALRNLPETKLDLGRPAKAITGIAVPVSTYLDKPRARLSPEDNRQGHGPKFAKRGKAGELASETPKDASRQSPAVRMTALKASILHNVRRVASLVARGEIDRAAVVCSIVAQQRGDLIGLMEKQAALLALDPVEAAPIRRNSPIKVENKVKHYPTWSDK